MNGEAGPLKEDLSTFNIEILQISKRIAPKSGLRPIAPHPNPLLARPPLPQQLLPSGQRPGAPPPALARRGNHSLLAAYSRGQDLGSIPTRLGAAAPAAASVGFLSPEVHTAPGSPSTQEL